MLKTIAAGTAGTVFGLVTGAVIFGAGLGIGYAWRSIDVDEKKSDNVTPLTVKDITDV